MKNPERVAELLAELRTLTETDFERHRIDVLERDLSAPPTVEVIDDTHQRFDGVTFSRSRQRDHFARHYYPLHRVVWQYHHGEIPEGYEIHHIDGDKANNDIANLQMLTKSDHQIIHQNQREPKEYFCAHCGKPFFAKQTSAKFCSHKCSQAWHYQHNVIICEICGKPFHSAKSNARCCSQECVNKAISNANTKEIVEKQCPVCGKIFLIQNSRHNQKCCSSECGAILGWQHSSRHIKEKTCPVCGKRFTPKESRTTCCSRSCGVKFGKQKRKLKQ